MSRFRLGIDIGGTFTDLHLMDEATYFCMIPLIVGKTLVYDRGEQRLRHHHI